MGWEIRDYQEAVVAFLRAQVHTSDDPALQQALRQRIFARSGGSPRRMEDSWSVEVGVVFVTLEGHSYLGDDPTEPPPTGIRATLAAEARLRYVAKSVPHSHYAEALSIASTIGAILSHQRIRHEGSSTAHGVAVTDLRVMTEPETAVIGGILQPTGRYAVWLQWEDELVIEPEYLWWDDVVTGEEVEHVDAPDWRLGLPYRSEPLIEEVVLDPTVTVEDYRAATRQDALAGWALGVESASGPQWQDPLGPFARPGYTGPLYLRVPRGCPPHARAILRRAEGQTETYPTESQGWDDAGENFFALTDHYPSVRRSTIMLLAGDDLRLETPGPGRPETINLGEIVERGPGDLPQGADPAETHFGAIPSFTLDEFSFARYEAELHDTWIGQDFRLELPSAQPYRVFWGVRADAPQPTRFFLVGMEGHEIEGIPVGDEAPIHIEGGVKYRLYQTPFGEEITGRLARLFVWRCE